MPRVSYVGSPSGGDGEEETTTRRRRILQAAGGLGVAGISSLAGCQGQTDDDSGGEETTDDMDVDVSGLTEVHSIELDGPTQQAGLDGQTAKLAFETIGEELPLDVSFNPMKYRRLIEEAFVNHNTDGWYSQFSLRPERLDPIAWFGHQISSNANCGGYNVAEYRSDSYDQLYQQLVETFDQDQKKEIVNRFQTELAQIGGDIPFGAERSMVVPVVPQVWNSELFTNVQGTNGIGIRDIWTWNQIEPTSDTTQLNIAKFEPASNLTPMASGTVNKDITRNVYDTLTRIGRDGATPEPWLATDWEISDDRQTITFQIRSGHSFHDGKPVTAEDVAFSYNYQIDEGPYYGPALGSISEAEAVNETTVRFDLQNPDSSVFTQGFNRVPIIPKHIWENIPGDVDADTAYNYSPTSDGNLVGSGHVKFENWRKGAEVVVSRYEDHWRPANIERMVFSVLPNIDTVVSQLEQGETHLLYQDTGADPGVFSDLAENNDNLSINKLLSIGNRSIVFNTQVAPFSFEAVRAACESVIPKQTMAREIRGDGARPGHGNLSQAHETWFDDEQKKWGLGYGGREEAIDILRENGFVIQDGTVYYPEGEAPDQKELPEYGCN